MELEWADTAQSDKVEWDPNTGWFRQLSCLGRHVLMCYVLLFLFTCISFLNESLCIKPVFFPLPCSSAHLFSSLCHFWVSRFSSWCQLVCVCSLLTVFQFLFPRYSLICSLFFNQSIFISIWRQFATKTHLILINLFAESRHFSTEPTLGDSGEKKLPFDRQKPLESFP